MRQRLLTARTILDSRNGDSAVGQTAPKTA
jgi:hypothetical protein